ncbi:hypothetical protein KSC_023690 [Ktedonobacter sp. SOSP1-52]|uniref:hypothetical protein n=1 Tax=Ktedonobacter sp. SOSP1-52 TaxID=2778366 RepID=UPI0019169411|nr:hypothetical protein [Ktedonobacter sp. SOSP1-52]GHO63477.1 hypothetical protein KSC_023690 [Ktedonobacter sp. SOSP1-52]
MAIEETLRKSIGPELYLNNVFRIIELPIDAEAREIARRQAIMKQALDISMPIPPGAGRILPLNKGPEPASFDAVINRLKDPIQRLIDEIFWFWPHQWGQSRSDEALLTLQRGEINMVFSHWQQLREKPEDEGIGLHNLAVLCHVLALDWENSAHKRELTNQEQQERDTRWQEALAYWKALSEHEAFWRRVSARIKMVDDPRLTQEVGQQLRASLPRALLSINASLAVTAAEQESVHDCQRHVGLLSSSQFAHQVVDAALFGAIHPIQERLKTQCKTVDTQTSARPSKANRTVTAFLDQALPMLRVLDLVLPEGNIVRDGMHDEIADLALTGVIRYGNATGDWLAYPPLVDRIEPIAVGDLTLARIEENDEAVDLLLDNLICWYCDIRPAVKEAAHNVRMFGNVRIDSVALRTKHITWQKLTIPVSRCRECQQLHNKVRIFDFLGAFLGLSLTLTSLFIFAYMTHSLWSREFWLFALFTLLIPIWIALVLGIVLGNKLATQLFLKPREVFAERDIRSFPPVEYWLKRRWAIGSKPFFSRKDLTYYYTPERNPYQ